MSAIRRNKSRFDANGNPNRNTNTTSNADPVVRPLTPRQAGREEFKERQFQDRLLTSNHTDKAWQIGLGTRGGKEGHRGSARREARQAEVVVKAGKRFDLGLERPGGSSDRVVEDDGAAHLSFAERPQVDIMDLVRPGRIGKPRGFASEPVRRPQTMPNLLAGNLGDYIEGELTPELLAVLFPAETPQAADNAEEGDEWEMADVATVTSFDVLSVVSVG